MKYAVHNYKNVCPLTRIVFRTFFRTKREALAYAATIEKPILEKKGVNAWIEIPI